MRPCQSLRGASFACISVKAVACDFQQLLHSSINDPSGNPPSIPVPKEYNHARPVDSSRWSRSRHLSKMQFKKQSQRSSPKRTKAFVPQLNRRGCRRCFCCCRHSPLLHPTPPLPTPPRHSLSPLSSLIGRLRPRFPRVSKAFNFVASRLPRHVLGHDCAPSSSQRAHQRSHSRIHSFPFHGLARCHNLFLVERPLTESAP